jgi:hypothetical protein
MDINRSTAATITDAQIFALFHADEIAAIDLAMACCTTCGGPIDDNQECRC